MKRDLFWSLVVYGVIIVSFFGIHAIFLARQGFDAQNYLTAFLLLFPASLIVGYIFLSQLLEVQRRHEERLEHLVREVLHEINLPLSTIEANLSLIRRKAEDEKLLKRIGRIDSASRRLAKLYRELAYELKREIAPAAKERFDLAGLLQERIESFRDLERNPIELDPDPLEIVADRIGLEQTVDNLLENAMKYSEADTPVSVVLKGTELRIRDRGIGMDENEILRIYERYYQSDRQIRGEGIGLAIVKRYCDENRLNLRIFSRPGEGTEVRIDFASCVAGKRAQAQQRAEKGSG